MSDEASRVAQWIAETLAGDSTITDIVGDDNVWELPAPPDATYPMVAFNQLSDVDVVTGAGAFRIMTNSIWIIRVVIIGQSYSDAITVADRIDDLFNRADGLADGATIFSSVREYGFRLADEAEGQQYRHLGGAFRIYAQR